MYYKLHPLLEENIINYYDDIIWLEKYDTKVKIDVFITDFSSMLYYFLYNGSEIILLNIDKEEFELGNHIYNEFDTDFAFTHLANDYQDIKKILENIKIKNNGKFFKDNLTFETGIYNYLIEGENNV